MNAHRTGNSSHMRTGGHHRDPLMLQPQQTAAVLSGGGHNERGGSVGNQHQEVIEVQILPQVNITQLHIFLGPRARFVAGKHVSLRGAPI